jgi:hypothetical protein
LYGVPLIKRAMRTTIVFTVIGIATMALQVSCMTGQTGTADVEPIPVNPTQDIRTSSDMNISPSNMTTSDPATTYADTTKTPKPAVKGGE